jgi:uncharacterized protein GlcG (DUF336 family)/NAD-dependent dihydropyrimidine dehydrogenase PreA subunit
MPYVITDLCTKDGSCVEVCPVACIHTTPDAAQFYIDPLICIECEQCEIVCPVDAIFLDTKIPDERRPSIDVNAAFLRQHKAAFEPIHVDKALAMVQAAQSYAARSGLAISVAVVDNAGRPIAMGRMDEAIPRSIDLAYNKAYTAARFHVPSAELVQQARRPWMRSMMIQSKGRVLPAGGGIPVVEGIAVLGAIGVAGGPRDEHDILCCRAGLAVLDAEAHH